MLYNISTLFVYKKSHYGELVLEFLFSLLSHTHTHTRARERTYMRTRAHSFFLNAFSFYIRLYISAFNFMLWNFWTQESSDGISQIHCMLVTS
jgi:hypothetical protein